MPFRIIRNDIINVEAEAVVNTANPDPVIGSGTETAIYLAAGKEALLAARQAIGPLEVGEAAWTPGFGLSARYIIHVVSPAWEDGRHGEEALLRKAYDAALQTALSLGVSSVAFPLLSAGNYGFPKETAMSVAVAAFTDFLMEHEMQIELAVFSKSTYLLAGSLFADVKSYVDDHYVGEKTKEEYGLPAMMAAAEEKALAMRRRRARPGRKAKELPKEDLTPFHEAQMGLPQAPALSGAGKNALGAASEVSFDGLSFQAGSLDEILKLHEKTFSERLMDLLNERGGKDSEVYKRAGVSKQLFSKILSHRDYQPTKSTAVQLAIGLELNLDETQEFLGAAGYALTRSSHADLVVQYFIDRGMFNVTLINEALYDSGLPLLKTGIAKE